MRKTFLNHPGFVESMDALMRQRGVPAKVKLRILKLNDQITAEARMLSEVQIGLYEANCRKDDNGACLITTVVDKATGREVETYDLLPEKRAVVNEQIQQLFDEDMVTDQFLLSELGPDHTLAPFHILLLREAGILLVDVEP